MSDETKKRIMHLVERYGSARCQEELAGARDAPPSVLKRHYDAGNEAWKAIEAEIDRLLAEHADHETERVAMEDFARVDTTGGSKV